MTTPSTISFASHYSPEQYASYMTAHKALGTEFKRGEPRFEAWSQQSTVLTEAVIDYLQARAEQGDFKPLPFSEGRHLTWADAWNRLANQDPLDHHDRAWLAEPLDMALSTAIEKAADHADLVQRVALLRFNTSLGDCDRTGERMYLQASTWAPVLGTYDRENGKFDFVPLTENAPRPGMQHVQIPVPTGELLIADWFRVPGFTEIVDANKRQRKSINTMAGKHETAHIYAREHGFASVYVGNSSPTIYAREGQLVIASEDPNAKQRHANGKEAGRVCTDIRWASVIDREVLTAIVAKTLGQVDAEKAVAEYIANDRNVNVVHVAAGQPLHVYFNNDVGLANGFTTPSVDARGLDEVDVVLSQMPLAWNAIEEKPAKKNRLRV